MKHGFSLTTTSGKGGVFFFFGLVGFFWLPS
jgi:hypothetical protein